MSVTVRFWVFVAISATLWLGFVPVYYSLFAWTEFVPGANWVYLPHGLRMMLVLLFGVAGVLGFSLASILLSATVLSTPGVPPLLHVLLAFVPGLAAWSAAVFTLKDWPGRHLDFSLAAGVTRIDGRRLILLALVSAILNAFGHAVLWASLGTASTPPQDRFVAMLVGDFLGALLLLYTLRGLLSFSGKWPRGSGSHDRSRHRTTPGQTRAG